MKPAMDAMPARNRNLCLRSALHSKIWPSANPTAVTPTHGTSTYAAKTRCEPSEYRTPGECSTVHNGASDPSDAGLTPSKRLWPAIITRPRAATTDGGRYTSADSTIIDQPSAHNTVSIVRW